MLRLQPGLVFARDFRVVRPLREGGMGAVYVVDQLSTGMRRALKTMQPALLEDSKARDRFAHEARVGAQIRSNHRVEVVGAGVDEATGMPWLAMELLEGEELAERVRRGGPLAPADVAEVLAQAGHALAAAHAAGIVHCDLKPENVFIADSAQRGAPHIVKVLDFGIARLLQEHRASVTVTTAIGSPLWMAPEQGARGAKVRPDTDIWALGLIAYWMLTGHYYWRAANVPDEQLNTLTLLVELATGPIDPPSQRAAEFGRPGALPPAFDAWFLRCLDREPSRRWPEAGVAVAELARALGVADAPPASASLELRAPRSALQGDARGPAGTVPLPTAAVPGLATTSPMSLAAARMSATRPGPRRARRIALGVAAVALACGATTLALRGPQSARRGTTTPATISTAPPVLAPLAPSAPGMPVTPLAPGAPAVAPTLATAQAPTAAPTPAALPAAPAACPEAMVQVPEGSFWMGSANGEGEADEHPQHRVHVPAFCIDRTEVTVAEWRACVAAEHCPPAPTTAWWPNIADAEQRRASRFCNAGLTDREEHPINCVEWEHARSFCAWRSERLPTEAEWEYAARGGDGRRWPWGNEPPDATRLNACGPECSAFFARELGEHWSPMHSGDDGWPTSAPVGRFPAGASPFGVLDMAGNVWEWTADWYGPYPAAGAVAVESPSGYAQGTHRIHRGGSRSTSTLVGIRAGNRDGSDPRRRDATVGFRCVLGPEPSAPLPGMGFAVASTRDEHPARAGHGVSFGRHRAPMRAPGGSFGDHRAPAAPRGSFGNHRAPASQ